MSNFSRAERLRRMMSRQECYFIGDKKSRRYHKKDCGLIDQIVKRDLEACGPNPEAQNFKPCPLCRPSPVAVQKERPKLKTKSEIMRQALAELADRHRMHIEFMGSTALVTTVAGEWFFDYNQRPIRLHHKNNDLFLRSDGTPISYYHLQEYSFETPMAALVYIYRHERAAERFAFEEASGEQEEKLS